MNKKEIIERMDMFKILAAVFLVLFLIVTIAFISVVVQRDEARNECGEEIEKLLSTKKNDTCYSEICYFDVVKNQVGACMMSETDCKYFKDKFGFDMEDGIK